MSAETRIAHFSITGEYLVDIARQTMLSDSPGQAYRLIAEGLCGAKGVEALAIDICRGDKTLSGDSSTGIKPEDDDAEAYKKQLAYIYAGRIKRDNQWIRPVAWMVQFGEVDAHWASERVSPGARGTEALTRWCLERAMYYAHNGEHVKVLEVDGKKAYVYFEPCGELPHWERPPLSHQEALDQYMAVVGALQERLPESNELADEELAADLDDDILAASREHNNRLWESARAVQEKILAEHRKALAAAEKDIRVAAGDDVFELTTTTGQTYKVPRVPFLHWATGRVELEDVELPKWEPFSPHDTKLPNDNRYHTDWMLGAGIPMKMAYDRELMDPAYDKAREFQEELRKPKRRFAGILAIAESMSSSVAKAMVVVDHGVRVGVVGEDVAVFPDAMADRAKELDGCVAAIVESGGPLAHLAIVSKGKGITMVRVRGAVAKYPEGTRVSIDPKSGRVRVLTSTDGADA